MNPGPVSSAVVTALDRMVELTAELGEAWDSALSERGLTPSRAEVIYLLHQQGPMVQRELSQALRCTPRHVTGLVDALEAQGWVARGPHPTDRRATLVALTEPGTAAAIRMDAERLRTAQTLFGAIPATDLTTFIDVADRVLALIGPAGRTPQKRTPTPAGR